MAWADVWGGAGGAAAILVVAFLVGAIPFSNLAAHRLRDVDLRDVGSGTVSGTALYRVTGFVPLAVTGLCDIGKGTVGPLLAHDRPALAAIAGGVAVAGHNWSPFLRGAGGRGLATAMGALAVTAWPGTLLLLLGLALGRLARHTGLGSFVAIVALPAVLAVTDGAGGALAGTAVAVPMLVKRLTGNAAPDPPLVRTLSSRLVFDRDPVPA